MHGIPGSRDPYTTRRDCCARPKHASASGRTRRVKTLPLSRPKEIKLTNEQRIQDGADAAIEQMEVGVDKATDEVGAKSEAIVSRVRGVGAETIKHLQESISRRPLTSLLAAMGAGVALSLFLNRR